MDAPVSDYGRFLVHWRRLPSHDYLDLAADLLETLGVRTGDPRLCASTPAGTHWVFPITINNRYVLAAQPGQGKYGIIARRLYFDEPCKAPLVETFSYRPFRNEAMPPDWRYLEDLTLLTHDPHLREEWIEGSAYELRRRQRSTFRRHNNAFLERLLTDDAFRAEWRHEATQLD